MRVRTQEGEPRYSRTGQVFRTHCAKNYKPEGESERAFAQRLGVPRSTLKHWQRREQAINAPDEVVDFLESPRGLEFLHKLVAAARLIFTQLGSSGIRQLCLFLELSGLSEFVGSSYGTQQQANSHMEANIVKFGQQEKQRLAPQMRSKEITVCLDENFHQGPCLVGIEPSSNFILVEEYQEKRDGETWQEVMQRGCASLRVKIVQLAGDQGSGLVRYAKTLLGVHYSYDLFHLQREPCKAFYPTMNSRLSDARKALKKAQKENPEKAEQWWEEQEQRIKKLGVEPTDYLCGTAQPHVATEAELEAQAQLKELEQHNDGFRSALQGISHDYHPFDLDSGAPCNGEQVAAKLNSRIDTLKQHAEAIKVPKERYKRFRAIGKMVEELLATVVFFHSIVQRQIKALGLSHAVEKMALEHWLPAIYIEQVAQRAQTAEERKKLLGVAQKLLAPITQREGELGKLSDWKRKELKRCLKLSAGMFVRSSSCVEGRNGQHALRHHSLHRLSQTKLSALTVLHNYFIKRADGTTAAERFFEQKPTDLFGYLLKHTPLPVRPAGRQKKAA